jgi:beta-barrel assembly-enhancing protease
MTAKARWLRVLLLILLLSPLILAPVLAEQTFRQRLSHLDTAIGSDADLRAELLFGREVAARILGVYGLHQDQATTRYINLLGRGLAAQGGRPELTFRFAILDSDQINAFAAPGGYVFITRGALTAMRNEAQLVAVLAHEIAHISQRHIVQELNIRGTEGGGSMFLSSMISSPSDPLRIALDQMVDSAVKILFERGYLRQDEFEADQLGTMITALAGYHSPALAEYLAALEDRSQEATRGHTGTHPPLGQRIERIHTFVTENGLLAAGQTLGEERFRAHVQN